MPDLESHWLAERLAYLGQLLMKDMVLGFKVMNAFPRLRSNPEVEGHCRLRDEALFACECRRTICNLPQSSDLFQS